MVPSLACTHTYTLTRTHARTMAAPRPGWQVKKICFTSDGSLLASGCKEGVVLVWDLLPVMDEDPNTGKKGCTLS